MAQDQDDSPMSQSSTLSEKRECACDSCWLARKSCDKFDPCSRCSQRGITCIFSGKGVRSKIASRKAQPRRQRKQTITPSDYFNSGIERLSNILNEQQLNSDAGIGSEPDKDAVDRIVSYISDAKKLLPDDKLLESICLASSYHESSRPYDEEPSFGYFNGPVCLALGMIVDELLDESLEFLKDPEKVVSYSYESVQDSN